MQKFGSLILNPSPLDVKTRLLVSGRSTPPPRGAWVPRHSFSDFGPKCRTLVGPGPTGPREFFEAFCMGVGNIMGLGGSKYRPPGGGVVGGWAGDPKVPGWDPPGVGKNNPPLP